MNSSFWRRIRQSRFPGISGAVRNFFRRFVALLEIPTPEKEQLLSRIITMERDIILPLRAAGIVMLIYSFSHRPWIGRVLGELELAVELTQYFLWFYVVANLLIALALFSLRRLPIGLAQWIVFVSGLLDGLFLSALTLVTGGYQSFLYWLFLGLIIRSAVSVPRATSQIALNATIIACYVLAGVINISIVQSLIDADEAMQKPVVRMGARSATVSTNRHGAVQVRQPAAAPAPIQQPTGDITDFGDHSADILGWSGGLGGPTEPLLIRLVLLVLMAACCYGVQVLLERQRRAAEEAREFAVRDAQLRSTGRFAAEFAHQIKNPLGIINNAAFSLQRSLKNGRPESLEQLGMIQEEVDRADRIITEVMGYAQLAEGHVERLQVDEELEASIACVFPPAAHFPIRIRRDYASGLPPLLMQRRHASQAFINVLQNAREALGDRGGNIEVRTSCLADSTIEVSISDDGPGVPPDKLGRIFEAYYTTKQKGTGLGLATVKQYVELYGGSVRVQSELGKGARFVLSFPARTLIKLAKVT